MTQPQFIALMAAIAVLAFVGMWFAWRARAKRDATVAAGSVAAPALAGELIADFPRVTYVSTTPEGAPFERLAIPGLRYKGYAAVAVHRDGVSVAVTGEDPVRISVAEVLGTDSASGRVGKAVERDGLALLKWRSTGEERTLESSFRFADPAQQRRFAVAVAEIAPTTTHPTIQEDA